MRMLRSAAAMAAIVLLGAGCDDSPAEPEFVSTGSAIESALVGGGDAVEDFTPRPAILARLTGAALLKVRHDDGAEAARAARASLQPYFEDFHTALQSHDTAAIRVSLQALRQAEATFIVSTLGTGVVTRALAFADERLDRLDRMIEHATAEGRDTERLQALATRLRGILDDAGIAEAAGDHATALIGAADVIGALHFLMLRAR